MASRRIVSRDKNILEKDDNDGTTPSASEKSSVAPAVPTSVIVKLLGFTVAMFAGPISVYFLTLHTLFKGQYAPFSHLHKNVFAEGASGNSTWAGATAAFTANIVLIAYVIVAMKDDESEKLAQEEKSKKAQ